MKRIARGQVWDVSLNPMQGAEIQKVRPCVVVSGDQIGVLRPGHFWVDTLRLPSAGIYLLEWSP